MEKKFLPFNRMCWAAHISQIFSVLTITCKATTLSLRVGLSGRTFFSRDLVGRIQAF